MKIRNVPEKGKVIHKCRFISKKFAVSAILLAALALLPQLPAFAAILADAGNPQHFWGRKTDAQPEKTRWDVGDTVIREIDGEPYRFRCIDLDYSDGMEYHRQGALFLCDTVIPANCGSRYEFEAPGDGVHGYVFYPGPIVNFGENNEYKYSAVRKWLKEAEPAATDAEPVNIGVFRAYSGSTAGLKYARQDGGRLTGSYIGSQKMADRLFILSVDEAIKYRDWLWRFNGSEEENPESQYGPFCKGYWLRSPVGTGEGHDTGLVYIVDLVSGEIRPAPIAPEDTAGETDAELRVTGTTGVRPAFVLGQN